jgi:penicillin-binding protein 1C
VNGVPVASAPFKRQAQYRPDGAGATRITVIDSAGASASVEVWIQ